MEWAIKILYLGMNLICENILKIEENWTNKFICSKHCKNQDSNNVDDYDDIDNESFDDFIKKIKNQNSSNLNIQSYQHNTNEKQSVSFNNQQNQSNLSTLNFPSNLLNSNTNSNSNNNSNDNINDIDHDKIKRLIDKMYLKTIIEENEKNEDNLSGTLEHHSPSYFSKKNNHNENRQIIFSRGVKEIENNVPEP